MSNRPSNSETTLVQLNILRLIPKSYYISSRDIHQKLLELGIDRSLRSVQRMLQKLCESFDIECDVRDHTYGYKWKPNARGIDLPILNEQQSLVLILAEQQLQYLLPANILSTMQPFFEQARRQLLNGEKSKLEREWLFEKITTMPMIQPLIPAKIDENIFYKISLALFKNNYLQIEYQNQLGKFWSKKIMPLAISQQGPVTYLVVRFDGFNDNRLLALHRIKKVEISTMTFERPKDFNLKEYKEKGFLGFGNGEKIRLRFSIYHQTGFHLTETPLSLDQIILEETPEYYRFQATVADSELLNWWICKFGEDIWDIEKEVISE